MNIVLFGGGAQLSYTIDILDYYPEYKIVGIVDSVKEIDSIHCGYKIIGRQEDIDKLAFKYNIEAGLISVGCNYSRGKIYDDIVAKCPNFKFINAIHPSAIISKKATIGDGVTIMAGCIINSGATLEDHVFLATGAQIEHDCYIGEFASVSAGSVLGGFVEIGMFTAVTLGVTILDRTKIGCHTVIGSGSLVTKPVSSYVVAYGNPASAIRSRKPEDKYLK